MASFTSYPELVETPFIVLKIGDYTFGMVSKQGQFPAALKIDFPNYMESLQVVKVNGTVNTYDIKMVYGVTETDDPNLLDKVFGTISSTRKVWITYGDWSSPNYVFKEEEAILTQLIESVDIKFNRISYTLKCTSACALLAATAFDFPKQNSKVTDVLMNTLYNDAYGLLEIFPGMRNKQKVLQNGLIDTDDAVVTLDARTSMDVLTYFNYITSCARSVYDNPNNVIRDSSYVFTVRDDINNELGGTYFTFKNVPAGSAVTGTNSVKTVNTNSDDVDTSKNLKVNSTTTFDLDIGYPGDNFVTDFSISSDDSWAILYNYAQQIPTSKWNYRIDNDGKMITTDGPNLLRAGETRTITAESSAWWTKMTQFPIQASVTIKGLIRCAMLMQYVRVNVWFYGRKHISSGLYIVTKQTDTVNSSGYRTELKLTRISGD